jgi:APA family basic amino acid/polyamine antiporter
MLVGTTIFVFRKKMPNAERGYRTIGYPVVPIIFIGICAWFIGFTLIGNPVKAGAGLVVAGVGFLAYRFYFKGRKAQELG